MPLKDIETKILKLIDQYFDEDLSKKYNFIPGKTYIPSAGKVIDSNEMKNIVLSALDCWLTTGRFNKNFEKKLAEFIGIKNLITVNSGSSANLLALTSLTSDKLKEKAIKKGDEIITVAAGFPTTINPILQNGAIPVFIDVNIPTYNVDINLIEKAITKKTKAIMLAHTLGNPFEVEEIKRICDKYNLWLIEDSCDALGSTYNNKNVGTFGDIASLSFYPAHHITMGEGGAIFTNSIKLKKIAESFRDWGRDCFCETGCDNTCKKRFKWQLGNLPFGYDHKFTYSHKGFNLKITDMQAACGLAQLDKLEFFIKKRKKNFFTLKKKLSKFEEYLILPEATKKSSPSWFGFPITIRDNVKFQRHELLTFLEEKKVGTRLLFGGNIIHQPYMKNEIFKISGSLVNTDKIMHNSFWIGVFPGINIEQIEYVSEVFDNFFKKNK